MHIWGERKQWISLFAFKLVSCTSMYSKIILQAYQVIPWGCKLYHMYMCYTVRRLQYIWLLLIVKQVLACSDPVTQYNHHDLNFISHHNHFCHCHVSPNVNKLARLSLSVTFYTEVMTLISTCRINKDPECLWCENDSRDSVSKSCWHCSSEGWDLSPTDTFWWDQKSMKLKINHCIYWSISILWWYKKVSVENRGRSHVNCIENICIWMYKRAQCWAWH